MMSGSDHHLVDFTVGYHIFGTASSERDGGSELNIQYWSGVGILYHTGQSKAISKM